MNSRHARFMLNVHSDMSHHLFGLLFAVETSCVSFYKNRLLMLLRLNQTFLKTSLNKRNVSNTVRKRQSKWSLG